MEVRLQKFLADAGVASRRKAEELILAGKIQVNGVTVTEVSYFHCSISIMFEAIK